MLSTPWSLAMGLRVPIVNAPMGGGTLFQARATVFLPANASLAAVRADLEKIASDLMVDFKLKPPA